MDDDNANFVKEIYKKYLNREPDEEGFQSYLNKLEMGELSQEKLEEVFKNCTEYKLNKIIQDTKNFPLISKTLLKLGIKADLSKEDNEIIDFVRPYSMTFPNTIFSLIECVKYVIKQNVKGDIVECGVWHGGSILTIIKTLLNLKSFERALFLFDTFEGWPEKTEFDIFNEESDYDFGDIPAMGIGQSKIPTLEQVKKLLYSTEYPKEKIHFIKGMVQNTLLEHAPNTISILRLDTDYYESTKSELVHLLPRLSVGGILIIDDYDTFQGQKKAVDEYFLKHNISWVLHKIERGVRIAVKN